MDSIQADANQQISQAHGEAREARESTIRVRTGALDVIHQAQDKGDNMLSEMQSQMQKLMLKIRQQHELIQELSFAKRVEVETPHLQVASSPQHPAASPSLYNLSHTDPSPVNPTLQFRAKSGIPLPISIATPKATSHHCADAPERCIRHHLSQMAVTSVENQIRELTNQMATLQDMLLTEFILIMVVLIRVR